MTIAFDITEPISKKQKVVKSIVRQRSKLSVLLPNFESFFILMDLPGKMINKDDLYNITEPDRKFKSGRNNEYKFVFLSKNINIQFSIIDNIILSLIIIKINYFFCQSMLNFYV